MNFSGNMLHVTLGDNATISPSDFVGIYSENIQSMSAYKSLLQNIPANMLQSDDLQGSMKIPNKHSTLSMSVEAPKEKVEISN
jgi:hypothetical protein